MPFVPEISVAPPALGRPTAVAERQRSDPRHRLALHARVSGLLGAVVLLCLLAALVVQQWGARDAVQQQLERQNAESARWLALALGGDAAATPEQREALLLAHLSAAHLARLQVRDASGRVVWQRHAEVQPAQAPRWYLDLLGLQPAANTAAWPGRSPQQPAGSVLVESQTADAADALWRSLSDSALVLAMLGTVVLSGAAWRVKVLRRALADAVRQANALSDGRYLQVAEPVLPELQPLTSSMNLLVERLQAMFDTQSAQLEVLRRQAHADALTGLPVRRHFLAQFEQLLAGAAPQAQLGLLLLRVRDLAGMNRRLGHAATDHVLQAVAQTLDSYPRRSDGCFAGRLNGADFALVLPVGGMAEETAQALVHALRVPLVTIDAAAGVSIGAVELHGTVSAQQALALADEALAHAETEHAFSAACLADDTQGAPRGEAQWQQRLTHALEQGQIELGAYPVCTADGRVLHLDCPMRVQLEPGGAFEPARRWLAQAARARLSAAVDEAALTAALRAIEQDGQARCINFAAQSLGVSDFMAVVAHHLEASPQAATRLWIDLPESLALDRPLLVQEAARRWRPLGVYLSLEHAGDGLARIPRLLELGLDCVRIDARYIRGAADAHASDARRYLRGLVQLVQAVGLSITAEGVSTEDELTLLWNLGFDAATGPAVRSMAADFS
ncbi:MAG: EAL domain-containing protein [Burkholderiales bacterium]|nr:EAL domain-containing protein [Burkholderiales bacterium]